MLDFHHRSSRLLLVRAGFRVSNTEDNNLKSLINIYKYEYFTFNVNIYFAKQTVGSFVFLLVFPIRLNMSRLIVEAEGISSRVVEVIVTTYYN